MYGYTPPQEYVDPFVEENTASTFLFTPKGLGRKEKRENWIWKGNPIRSHKHTEPFSYEYVMQDGHLANITEVHPAADDKAAPPRRTRSISKKVTFSDRHSSPIEATGTSDVPEVKKESLRRAKSLSNPSSRPQPTVSLPALPAQPRLDVKALPLLPKPTTGTHARASLERTVSEFDIQFAQWGAPPQQGPLRHDLAQQLLQTRPSPVSSRNATPRHSPTSSRPISPCRSFEEPRTAPSPPAKHHRAASPLTPPSTPPSTFTTHAIVPPPTLRRRPSKFIEHLDESRPIPRIDVTRDLPTSPVTVVAPPPDAFAIASAAPPSPAYTPRSSLENTQPNTDKSHRRVDSLIGSARSSLDKGHGHNVQVISSPDILQLGLPTRAGHHAWPLRDPNEDGEYMMSGALRPPAVIVSKAPTTTTTPPAAVPRRSATLRAKGEKAFGGSFVNVGQVCMAEVRPVLRSPVVASGTARLVSC